MLCERLSDRIDQLTRDIEIEDRGVHLLSLEEVERLVHAACWADDVASRLSQHVLELEGDKRLILDNEDLKAR